MDLHFWSMKGNVGLFSCKAQIKSRLSVEQPNRSIPPKRMKSVPKNLLFKNKKKIN